MPHFKKPHTFGLYSTSKQSHIKVGSRNRRSGVRLTKTLIHPPSFELELMVDAKRSFVSVTLPNDFDAYFLDKFVHFVSSDMSETCLCII